VVAQEGRTTMVRKPKYDYFDAFLRIGTLADEEADKLLEILKNFDPDNIHAELDAMHELENAADLVNHEVYTNIISEFITPIDREDIIRLTQELDEVVDHVEDILQRIYMFNIREIIPEALEMVIVIAKSTEALRQVLIEFPNYKKSKDIKRLIVEVNTYEEEGDRLYIETLHKLYSLGGDPLNVVAWTKTFDRLERCCDSCEHAADVITTIIMKNS
jgi:uncharacterized protein